MSARRLAAWLLAQGLVVVVAASCGGSTTKSVASAGAPGEAGEGGSNDAGGGRGGNSGSATAGAHAAGTSAAGNAGETQSEGGRAGNGEGGSNEAGAGDAAGAAGAGDETPPIDVGPGCLPPASAPQLSPAAAGLPVAGLTLWLRSDRGVYATDQHRVCAWADQSGNQFLFTAGSGSRPLWTAGALGAQPALDFDATNALLSTSGALGIAATSGRTFITVVQSVDTTGRFAAVQQGQSGTAGTYLGIDANTYNTAGSKEGVYVTNNSYDSTFATGTTPHVHVFTVTTMTPGLPVLANVDYRVNGASQTLTRREGGLGHEDIESVADFNFTLVGAGARSLMAEAIIYNRPLSLEERAAVETALKTRYGIQ